jgi:hypothetical protein
MFDTFDGKDHVEKHFFYELNNNYFFNHLNI